MTLVTDAHFYAIKQVLDEINIDQIDRIVDKITQSSMILTCGNGGSAATAIHFASDLRSLGFLAFDLLSPSKVTQIDNDEGHGYIFSHQVIADALVIAFSGSGTSENIKRIAYEYPHQLILITSEMKPLNYPGVKILRVDSMDYEVIEDVHLCICHAIKKELKQRKE